MTALRAELGENLYSCCLYGSAVRGNSIEGVSDLNLLIVLKVSNRAAQDGVARAIGANPRIDPFVLGLPGLARSVRAFAPKFSSIKHNYRVLHGADPLAEITLDPGLERFLCEQALRNLRLRLAYAYVTRARTKSYPRFLTLSITPTFLRLTEVIRLSDDEVPREFPARIPIFEKALGIDGAILGDLLELKRDPTVFSRHEDGVWHERLFAVLDQALAWIEQNWPSSAPQS